MCGWQLADTVCAAIEVSIGEYMDKKVMFEIEKRDSGMDYM